MGIDLPEIFDIYNSKTIPVARDLYRRKKRRRGREEDEEEHQGRKRKLINRGDGEERERLEREIEEEGERENNSPPAKTPSPYPPTEEETEEEEKGDGRKEEGRREGERKETQGNRRRRFMRTAEALRQWGLLDITLRTARLLRCNSHLQHEILSLQQETRIFVASVLQNPENRDILQNERVLCEVLIPGSQGLMSLHVAGDSSGTETDGSAG